MKLDRRLWFGLIALATILLLTLLTAPNNQFSSGSTFSRSPDGYAAWFAYMQQQGRPIERWQRSPTDFLERKEKATGSETLVQVNSRLQSAYLNAEEKAWVDQGNTLVILGVRQPATEAAFSTEQSSPVGKVKIDTSRRHLIKPGSDQRQEMGDREGAIVWSEPLGKGKVVYATTPYLAANAYQDAAGNFQFLAQLVTQSSNSIWVDEYRHGYREAETVRREIGNSWTDYLGSTPLLPALVQLSVVIAIVILAQNRRFGPRLSLSAPSTDNSEAYMQALASVLQKAGSSEFVLDVIGKEEQRQLQRALGLGETGITFEELATAWVQQTGRPMAELQQVLSANARNRRMSESELLIWLENLKTLRQHLP